MSAPTEAEIEAAAKAMWRQDCANDGAFAWNSNAEDYYEDAREILAAAAEVRPALTEVFTDADGLKSIRPRDATQASQPTDRNIPPPEPSKSLSGQPRESDGIFSDGGRVANDCDVIPADYPLVCVSCGRRLPCRHCEVTTVEEVRAEERERIAVAIERDRNVSPVDNLYSQGYRDGYNDSQRIAAQIARTGGRDE